MKLQHQSLLDELMAMKQRMDALYARNMVDEQDRQETRGEDSENSRTTWVPPVDIWENDKEWIVVSDLPGVSDKDLEVEILGRQLTIKGSRQNGKDFEKNFQPRLCERTVGSFLRVLDLPADVEEDAVTAEFKQGILVVRVAKRPKNSHKIVIHAKK